MKRMVIDGRAVVKNLEAMRRHSDGAAMYAVLMGDGYGAGLEKLALLLRDHGVTRFAISEPEEAKALRKAGLVEEELLMLRSTVNREELEALMDLNVVCSIGSAEAGMALNALAESRSTIPEAHVQLDSGMGYGGFTLEETDKILAVFQNLQSVAISGVYTQLQSVGVSKKTVAARLEAFGEAVKQVQRAGFETGIVHAAGSFSTIQYDFSHLDAVRVGSALLGRCKRTRDDGLQKVGYCEASIEEIRWLPKGHTVGYEHPTRLKRPTRVATLAVGYQNGLGVS
ncbi:MAG: alanine racemase, partial [Muribaculaceae bacterium]|nr:alanine racemase [Muribaculaceae bacterium]